MHHFIAKQITELSLRNAKEAYKVQNDFANAFRREAMPMLEKLFDRLFDGDEVVRIEKLEIDLGNLSSQQLSSGNFIALLQEKLEEALTVHIHQSEQAPRRLPMPKNHFEQWLYFLKNGSFSWEMPQPKQEKWLRDVLDTLGTEIDAITQLTQLLRKNNTAFKRLILQYEPAFLKTIAELFTGYKQDQLIPFLKEWQQIRRAIHRKKKTKTTSQTLRETEQIFWLVILEKVIIKREKQSWKALCADYILADTATELILEIPRVTQQKNKAYPLVVKLLEEKNINQYISKKDLETLGIHSEKEKQSPAKNEAKNKNKSTEKLAITKPENNSPAKHTEDEMAEGKLEKDSEKKKQTTTHQHPNTSTPQHINTTTRQDISPPTQEDKDTRTQEHINTTTRQHDNTSTPQHNNWYIPNAGIIMLHPFLGHLFKKLKLTKTGKFKNAKATQKAILLLHYLATGETKTPEYQLTLPKFLCGIPLNTPIDHYIKLTKKEQKEAENLLQAAIEHWGALGKVSNASLREGFLKREGKLEKTSTGWLLQIEKQTIDILLDRLPWNLSIIKLPEMEDVLKVDWR